MQFGLFEFVIACGHVAGKRIGGFVKLWRQLLAYEAEEGIEVILFFE